MSSSLRRASSRRAVSFEAKLSAPTTDAVVDALDARRVSEEAITGADWPRLAARLGVPAEQRARRTPLHALCGAASDAAVRHVVRALTRDANSGARKEVAALWLARDATGCTPLHAFALRVPACDALTRFVVKRVAEWTRDALCIAETTDADTPAHYFAAAGNVEGVRACLRAAPQLEAAANARGETPRALECEHTSATNATLRSEVATLRQTVLDEQELRLFMRHANDEIEARDARIKQLEAENEKARGRITELERTVKGKEAVERDAVDKRRAAERAMRHAEKMAGEQEAALEARVADLAAAERELAELRAAAEQLADAEQRAAAAEQALQRAEEAERQLEAARRDADAARAALDDERGAADSGDAAARERLLAAQRALEAEKERVAELEARATKTDAARAAAEEARAAEMHDQLVAAERALEAERARVAELEAAEDELDAALADARRTAAERDAAAAAEAEELETRADALAAERDAAAARAAALEEEHARAVCERAELDARRDSEQCAALEKKAASLAAELDAARAATGARTAALHAARTDAEAARAEAEAQAAAAEARVAELECAARDAQLAEAAAHEQVAELRAALDRERTSIEKSSGDIERVRAECDRARAEAQAARAAQSRGAEELDALRASLDRERATVEELRADRRALERATERSLALATARPKEAPAADSPSLRALADNGLFFANVATCVVRGDTETLELLLSAKLAFNANTCDSRGRPYVQIAVEEAVRLERMRAANPSAFAESEAAAILAHLPATLRTLLAHGGQWDALDTYVDEERHGVPESISAVLAQRDSLSPFVTALLAGSLANMITHAPRMGNPNHVPTQFTRATEARLRDKGATYTHVALELWYPCVVDAIGLLAERDGIDFNRLDALGRAPLHIVLRRAAEAKKDSDDEHRCVELVELLLAYGADPHCVCHEPQTVLFWAKRATAAGNAGDSMLAVAAAAAREMRTKKRVTVGLRAALSKDARAEADSKRDQRLAAAARQYCTPEAMAALADNERLQRLTSQLRFRCVADERLAGMVRDRALMHASLVRAYRAGELAAHTALVSIFEAVQHVLHHFNPHAPRDARIAVSATQRIADELERNIVAVLLRRLEGGGTPRKASTPRRSALAVSTSNGVTAPPKSDALGTIPTLAPPPALAARPKALEETPRSGVKNGTIRAGGSVTAGELARYRITLESCSAECRKGTDVHLLVETLLKSVEVLADRHFDVDDRIYRSASARFDAAVRGALRSLVGDEGNPQALAYVLGRTDGLFGAHAQLDTPLDDGLTCVQLAVARGYVAKLEWALRKDERVLAQRTRDGASIGALAVQHKQPLVLVAIDYHVACRERAALAAAAADENTGVNETERRLRSASGRSEDGSQTTTSESGLALATLTAENCAADHRRDYGMKTASGATVLHLCVHQCRDDLLAFCLASVGFHRDTECRGETPLVVAERRLESEAGGTLSDAERTSLRRCVALLKNQTPAVVAHATRERRATAHVPAIALFPPSDDDKLSAEEDDESGSSTTDTPRRRHHRHKSKRHQRHKSANGERSESRRRHRHRHKDK